MLQCGTKNLINSANLFKNVYACLFLYHLGIVVVLLLYNFAISVAFLLYNFGIIVASF